MLDFGALLSHHILDQALWIVPVGNYTIRITKHMLMMWIASALLIAALRWISRGKGMIPSRSRSLAEMLIVFIRDEIVAPNLGAYAPRYLHYFLTLFFFILCCNLIGLVPFGATATGNISVTATLAFTTFLLVNISGMAVLGPIGYVKNLVPSHMPLWLVPFVFFIELIGLITKHLALCIRLFANMFAGHLSILVIFGIIFMFPKLIVQMTIAPFSVLAALGLELLEIFVAILQAYIFTFLTAIFTGMAMQPEH
jgi:F-type H+-transporting ATPase subunit a